LSASAQSWRVARRAVCTAFANGTEIACTKETHAPVATRLGQQSRREGPGAEQQEDERQPREHGDVDEHADLAQSDERAAQPVDAVGERIDASQS